MNDSLRSLSESLANIPTKTTPGIPTIKAPRIGNHQLVVLGNGFDLECGLPTRFSHFFEPRLEALTTQDWEKTGKLDDLGYEATPTAWDFLLRSRMYAPWYSVEDAVSDLVLSAGDGKSEPTGLAAKLIARVNDLMAAGGENAADPDDGAEELSDDEDLLNNVSEFIAVDCADELREAGKPWSSQRLVDYLGTQIDKLERNFSNYMVSVSEGNEAYIERAQSLLSWMLADGRPLEEDLVFNTTVLSFNYTNPFKRIIGRSETVGLINVHGNLDGGIIFGIDGTKCVDNPLAFPFSKTYRVMTAGTDFGEGAVHATGGGLLSHETRVVKFFGHSLGEADYAYFQAIFDSVNLYASDTKLVFYCKPHRRPGEDDGDASLLEKRTRNNMAAKVTKLLAEYGKTLDNEDHGRNLMHKLMIEGRLEVRLMKNE